MKMEYKILDNGTAIVLTRRSQLVYGDLDIAFLGAPSGATAIFDSGSGSLYRPIHDGTCSVPADKLDGAVKVTVALLDGGVSSRKWACEELLAEKQKNGGTLVSPNDVSLSRFFVEMKLENEKIRQGQEYLEERIKELEDRLAKLFEGYDLI